MKLNEIKAKLDELGIAYKAKAKKSELEALLLMVPTNVIGQTTGNTTVESELVTTSEPVELKTPVKTDAIVIDKNGEKVRTYSLEIHGAEFDKLAQEFAKKISGKVV